MLQDLHDKAMGSAPVDLPLAFTDMDSWRYRQVKVVGTYVPEHQILLDNQVALERAGYHVITPLQIKQSGQYVLVDRGWVPAPPDRSMLPEIETPAGEQQIIGHLWLPSAEFYSLEQRGAGDVHAKWETVWQNMDMARYQRSVSAQVLPLVIRMDAASSGGGFLRAWPRPAERITTHIGYAYQWFGFSIAALFIWLFTSFKRQGNR